MLVRHQRLLQAFAHQLLEAARRLRRHLRGQRQLVTLRIELAVDLERGIAWIVLRTSASLTPRRRAARPSAGRAGRSGGRGSRACYRRFRTARASKASPCCARCCWRSCSKRRGIRRCRLARAARTPIPATRTVPTTTTSAARRSSRPSCRCAGRGTARCRRRRRESISRPRITVAIQPEVLSRSFCSMCRPYAVDSKAGQCTRFAGPLSTGRGGHGAEWPRAWARNTACGPQNEGAGPGAFAKSGGVDGTRTRDLRRDRPAF